MDRTVQQMKPRSMVIYFDSSRLAMPKFDSFFFQVQSLDGLTALDQSTITCSHIEQRN